MRPAIAVWLLAIWSTSACNLGRCTYETRFVGTSGTASAASGKLLAEYVNMREYRDGGPVANSIVWSVKAENLTSPPKTLTLRNATNASVLTLTMQTTSDVSMSAVGDIDTAAGDSRFALLSGGTATLALELENGALIIAELVVMMSEDWHRPNCS